jgi:hypothetical protein
MNRFTVSKTGSATLLVMGIVVIMAAAIAGFMAFTNSNARAEVRSNYRLKALYAAEHSIEKIYSDVSAWLSTNRPAIPTLEQATTIANLSNAPTSAFPASEGYRFGSYLLVPVENGVAVNNYTSLSQSTNTYRMLAIAEVQLNVPTMTSPVRSGLQRELIYTLTPLFQFAIFYNNDLELFPGANFVVGGRVHSNGKFYNGSNASLTFKSFVTSVNGTVNQHHPDDPRTDTHGNNVTYEGGAPFMTTREEPPATGNGTSSVNNDGPRELIEVPSITTSDPNADERMFNKAGLKLLVNTSTGSITAPNGLSIPAGGRVFLTADGTVIPNTETTLLTLLNDSFSSGSIKDFRENYAAGGATVTTIDVNVGKLRTNLTAGNIPNAIPNQEYWPAGSPGGLSGKPIASTIRGKNVWNRQLYVADVSFTTSRRVGVRLINGESLPTGGLTVTTENPVYIVGNYNTGGNPPSNTGAATDSSVVSGYYEPAAVMADAVTVISSNWTSGGYDTKALGSRDATATTINAALVSGIVKTTSTAYSGGSENYLRLLEDWGGVRLTYYGSIVNLYESAQATSIWRTTGGYYQAATRNWHFDVNFNDPNKLPAGTPVTRSLKMGQWMQLR